MPGTADYKSTWDALAATEHSALLHVAGYTDEAQLEATARDTVARLRATVTVAPTDEVLEIGCGVARVGQRLAPLVRHWTGADVSARMLEWAGRRLAAAGVNNTRLIELSGYDLAPVADGSLDLVYCTVVFMHLEEWERFRYVREAHRVLRPGGRFYCDNFNLASEGGWQVFAAGLDFPPGGRPPHLSRASTLAELQTYLARAGFREVGAGTVDLWVQAWGRK